MSPASTRRPKILLVDDSEPLRRSFARLLDRHGFEVLAVDGADAAVTAVSTERFDLAIVDLEMPKADGWTTIARLGAIDPHLAAWAILFTGAGLDADLVARAGAAGIALVAKGSNTADVLAVIRERLDLLPST